MYIYIRPTYTYNTYIIYICDTYEDFDVVVICEFKFYPIYQSTDLEVRRKGSKLRGIISS